MTPERGMRAYSASIGLARDDEEVLRESLNALDSLPGNKIYPRHIRATIAELSGNLEAAEEERPTADLTGGLPGYTTMVDAMEARLAYLRGDHDAAERALARWANTVDWSEGFGGGTLSAGELSGSLVQLLSDETLAQAYDALTTGSRKQQRLGEGGRGFDYVRGLLALRLGRVEDAEQHFEDGLEWCERERCPVEAGRNLQGLAEVAERRGERAQALEYLDRAGELFSQHGAKLYLDQVLEKKAELSA